MINTSIVQFCALFHLPLSDMRLDQYSLSGDRKLVILASDLAFFHSNSMNIGLIANLKAGGERAHKTAHFAYWSCHNTIRTQIHNWGQSWAELKGTVKSNSGAFPPWPKTRGLLSDPGNTPTKTNRVGFLAGSWTKLNRTASQIPDRWQDTQTSC